MISELPIIKLPGPMTQLCSLDLKNTKNCHGQIIMIVEKDPFLSVFVKKRFAKQYDRLYAFIEYENHRWAHAARILLQDTVWNVKLFCCLFFDNYLFCISKRNFCASKCEFWVCFASFCVVFIDV